MGPPADGNSAKRKRDEKHDSKVYAPNPPPQIQETEKNKIKLSKVSKQQRDEEPIT